MSKVIIVGGGAAGMLAAIIAASSGHQVSIYEKNEKLGKKLYITGKGRCNLTNACDIEELFQNVVTNEKFLYSSFYGFSNQDTIKFFNSLGLCTKVERGNRVFPVSNHSSDVIGVLSKELRRLKVGIYLNTAVDELIIEDRRIGGVKLKSGNSESAHAVIVATGGLSYETTGSTGDGYRFAKYCGHTVTELMPALVPMEIKEDFPKQLQGLSLKNIRVTIMQEKKELYSDFGEMLFTHFGVSGPLIISAGGYIAARLKNQPLTLLIDLKPALSLEQLDQRIRRDFDENRNKQFKNSINQLFPSKLIPIMIELSGINPDKKVNEITKEERLLFVQLIKKLAMTITAFRGYNEAVITKGGISVKEINPSTMESKLIKGLFFVGEVLDVDALTGGFNLQIAWSTAYMAGKGIEQ